MSQSNAEFILDRLKKSAETGKLDGLEIEYWVRGGQPPPHYRSEQLRLLTREGHDLIEFAVQRWDKNYSPPNLLEKWTAPLSGEVIRRIAEMMWRMGLEAKYQEETSPRIADIFLYDIAASAGGRELRRTFYKQTPQALAPLTSEFQKLIEFAKSRGTRGLYHSGKRVGP